MHARAMGMTVLAGVLSGVVVAGGATTSARATQGRPAAATDATAHFPSNCTPEAEDSPVVYSDIDTGQRFTTPGTNRAEVHSYPGGEIVLPPVGWSPLQATDVQLRHLGFPPRPTDATALASWTARMSVWHRPANSPGLCEDTTGMQASLPTLANWAGAVTTTPNNDIQMLDAQTRIPNLYIAACETAASSSMSEWIGLQAPGGLIQNGWVTDPGSVTDAFAFYEVFGKTYDTHLQYPGNDAEPGYLVQQTLYYAPSSEGYDPGTGQAMSTIEFWWTVWDSKGNFSSDGDVVLDRLNGLGGHNASDFYQGGQGEDITERIKTANFTQMRAWSAGAGWANAYVAESSTGDAEVPIGTLGAHLDNMNDGGQIAHVVGGVFNSDKKSWNMAWDTCGPNQG